MLDQTADESFHRADQNTMQHNGPMRRVIGAGVLEAESLREIEVELHGRTLPLSSDGVDQLVVELRLEEGPSTFVVRECLSALAENFGKRVLRLLPQLRTAEGFVGAGGELDGIRVPKGLEHLVTEIEQAPDLCGHLFRRAENVGVVLGEAAHAHHPVQHAASLVPIHSPELGVADRQIPIRSLVRLVDDDVARAVHRLRPITRSFDIHRAEHVLLEVLQVPGDLEELLVYDVRREHEIITVTKNQRLFVLLDLVPNDRTLRMPKNKTRTDPWIG